ncbi:MAG: hypothetical protein R2851_24460 [Caldilineaceae bacterium]
MKSQPVGPSKFSLRAKTTTTALAVTSMIGVWNIIGHLEAAGAQPEPATESPANEAPLTEALIAGVPLTEATLQEASAAAALSASGLNLPAIAPLPTPAPIPTLAAPPTSRWTRPTGLAGRRRQHRLAGHALPGAAAHAGTAARTAPEACAAATQQQRRRWWRWRQQRRWRRRLVQER